jgi:hypothetical protein
MNAVIVSLSEFSLIAIILIRLSHLSVNTFLNRFKTRNTYKRHLQTKHSKMLTSKGIFDLPDTNVHIRKPCPPRRKYGLGFLHQNIEAVARYERAQEEVKNKCHIIDAIDSNHLLLNDFNSSKNEDNNRTMIT